MGRFHPPNEVFVCHKRGVINFVIEESRMKFKSNTPVTAQDLELAEVQFESLDFTEMDKAQELLEDLTVLNQNIEKFGITEPVMHLVGGTLEAMDISIASKEACLEGLGDKMKEAGKKIWEFIINLFKKIRDFVKAWLDKGAKKSIEVYNGVKEKFSNVNAEGLLPKDAIAKVKEFARTAPNSVKNTSIDIANSAKGLLNVALMELSPSANQSKMPSLACLPTRRVTPTRTNLHVKPSVLSSRWNLFRRQQMLASLKLRKKPNPMPKALRNVPNTSSSSAKLLQLLSA